MKNQGREKGWKLQVRRPVKGPTGAQGLGPQPGGWGQGNGCRGLGRVRKVEPMGLDGHTPRSFQMDLGGGARSLSSPAPYWSRKMKGPGPTAASFHWMGPCVQDRGGEPPQAQGGVFAAGILCCSRLCPRTRHSCSEDKLARKPQQKLSQRTVLPCHGPPRAQNSSPSTRGPPAPLSAPG